MAVTRTVDKVTFVMINDFLIDVALTETHEFEADVTEYPVESGSSISDNIRSKPIMVTMEGLVSNSPLEEIAKYRIAPAEPVADAYAMLLDVRDKREPVTIRTSLGTFENMALQSLSIPRDGSRGDALRFTAKFQQIQTVTNVRGKRLRTSIPGGKRKVNLGHLTAALLTPYPTSVTSYPQSLRKSLIKSLGNPVLSTVEADLVISAEAIAISPPGGSVDDIIAGSYRLGTRPRDGRGPLDHYAIKVRWDTKPDGYVWLGQYKRTAISGGSSTQLNYSIGTIPVEYDYNKQSWVTADSRRSIVRQVPQKDRWRGVTSYDPKNGTIQSY